MSLNKEACQDQLDFLDKLQGRNVLIPNRILQQIEKLALQVSKKNSSHLFWTKTTLKIKMGPNYDNFWSFWNTKTPMQERCCQFLHIIAPQRKKIFNIDLSRKNQAWNYEEKCSSLYIYQNWKISGILGLSGFWQEEKIRQSSKRVVYQGKKLKIEHFNLEIKSVVMENHELEYRKN